MKRVSLFFLTLFVAALLSHAQSDTTAETSSLRQAEFPGGLDSLYKYLEQSFRISRTDLQFQQHEDLIADVRLTINKKGQVVNINTGMSRIEYELERAFMSLPNFIPATENSKPVTSYVELKFMFFIKGNRMEVSEHLQYNAYMREKESSWIKAAIAAGAILIFLLLWGG